MDCIKCRNCCKQVESLQLLPKDRDFMVGKNPLIKDHLKDFGLLSYYDGNYEPCLFLDKDRQECTLGDNKPKICQLYPLLMNQTSVEVALATSHKKAEIMEYMAKKCVFLIDIVCPRFHLYSENDFKRGLMNYVDYIYAIQEQFDRIQQPEKLLLRLLDISDHNAEIMNRARLKEVFHISIPISYFFYFMEKTTKGVEALRLYHKICDTKEKCDEVSRICQPYLEKAITQGDRPLYELIDKLKSQYPI